MIGKNGNPRLWMLAVWALLLCLASVRPGAAGTGDSGELDVGSNGAAFMHGDPASSDTTGLGGPGIADLGYDAFTFFAACPTVLIRSDGKPFILSTAMIGRNLVIRLLEPRTGETLASLMLEPGSLLGGIYAYLDSQDRLVMVDGRQRLIWVSASTIEAGAARTWRLAIDQSVDLDPTVSGHCGGEGCDAVVSIGPGPGGTVWFVSQKSVVGVYDPSGSSGAGAVHHLRLGEDERIDNSFSTTRDGRAAIVTDRALYLLAQTEDRRPYLVWRREYERGSARKPGQLSHGSGATPTFFGEDNRYVMITDNADERISLVVRDALIRDPGQEQGGLICQERLFTPLVNSGTESSAIGFGNSAVVVSTYGYPYPALPEGAPPSEPESADFVGGMVRVDVVGESGGETPCQCRKVWENQVRSAAVPKLSTVLVELPAAQGTEPDRLIYTVERVSPEGGFETTGQDDYYFTVVRFGTGEVLKQTRMGTGDFEDTLQMAGNIGPDGVFWQGTISGVVRLAPPD